MDIHTILILTSFLFAPQGVIDRKPKQFETQFETQVGARGGAASQAAADWKRQVARARLALDVDGRPEQAAELLAGVIERLVAAPAFEGRDDVVIEILETGVPIAARGRDPRVSEELLAPTRARPNHPGAVAWEALLAPLRADPRFVAVAERLQSAAGGASTDAGRIEALVRAAVRDGGGGVRELGVAAAPTLEAILREDPEALPGPDRDALDLLVACAPQRAAGVCLELLRDPRAGFLLRKRVLRAMQRGGGSGVSVLRGDGSAWRFDEVGSWSDRPPVLLEPAWRDVLTAVTSSPLVAGDALPLVKHLVDNDALDGPLRQSLLALARSGDPGAVSGVARALGNGALRPTVRPLLEALLQSPAVELRLVAANHLSLEARSEALLSRVGDPEPRVRAAVAAGLAYVDLKRPLFHPNGPTLTNDGVRRLLQDRDRPVLLRLLADSDGTVRRAAIEVAALAGQALDAATAEKLLEDGDARVRTYVPALLPRDPSAAAPLLERALADGDSGVRDAAVTELLARFGIRTEPSGATTTRKWSVDPTPALLPLAVGYLIPGPATGGDARRWMLVGVLTREAEDATALVRAYLAAPSVPSLAAQPLAMALSEADGDDKRGTWRFLEAGLVRGLLRRVDAEKYKAQSVLDRLPGCERPPAVREGIAAVVRDTGVSRILRIGLLPSLREQSDLGALIAQIYTQPAWEAAEADGELLERTRTLAEKGVPMEALRLAVPQVLAAAVPDAVVARFFQGMTRGGDGPAEYSQAIVARLSSAPDGAGATTVVNWAIQREADKGRWDTVHAALESPRSRAGAIEALARGRPPEGLAWLAALLYDPASTPTDGIRSASAISGYLSDEAAEILLRGAELAPGADVRKACLDGIGEIRAFLDQKAGWRQRASGTQQRDAAVAELVVLLDSREPIQRAEAVRGLATLEAAEHLPRLIRMLQDPDAGVRKAVQESLDRLNRPR